MPDLNDMVRLIVSDASVVTVPLVDNLTASNAAPKASTVGAALALKVDTATIMQHVTITFNEIESDNQGVILATGEDIPVNSDSGAVSIADKFEAVADQIEDAIDEAVQTAQTGVAMSVENIAPDSTTHDISLAGLLATTAGVNAAIDEVLAGQ